MRAAFEGVTFLEVLQGLAATPEPADVGEAQAEAVRFGAGLDLLGPHLGDGGVTIGSAVERMRAAGEHAKVEARLTESGGVGCVASSGISGSRARLVHK